MHVHTKSRMAIAAMLDIAVHGHSGPVPLTKICERQRVSKSCLERLFRELRSVGFVAGSRGPGGGYQLNRGLADISVGDIIDAVDREPFDCRSCNGPVRASEVETCATSGLWCRFNDQMHEYLRSITLESVLAGTGGMREMREAVVAVF